MTVPGVGGGGRRSGALAWMAQNAVAANLLMMVLIVGGVVVGLQVKQEVFPEFAMSYVVASVAYPGASPAEVEQGIVLAIEEAVRGVEGVKRIQSSAGEGMASVLVELLVEADPDKALADVKSAVDRIVSFPQDAERPVVSLLVTRHEVVTLAIHGDLGEEVLRAVAEDVRDELLTSDDVTYIELSGVRPVEVAIEVPQANLRRYGLTLEQLAREVGRSSVELPAGGVKTPAGEVLLRTDERRLRGQEFRDIAVLSTATGAEVKLGDIATIRDGFAETDEASTFDGQPAVLLEVYRVGDETPVQVARAVKAKLVELEARLPETVSVSLVSDWSEIFEQRMDLLMRNAMYGLALVMFILGLLLEPRLAFWVTMGIPISFAGSLLFMPAQDATINMLTMFAFIVTLGMVVDDAIIVGENIHHARQRGMSPMRAAIRGVREVAMPVTFSVLTTVAAFMPLYFVSGIAGKFYRQIPAVVVAVMLVSLVESFFVLPAHLGHLKRARPGGWYERLLRPQRSVGRALEWFIERVYQPQLRFALSWRYLTMGTASALMAVTIGFVASGRIAFTFMPKIESDRITATAVLPYGSAVEDTKALQARLLAGVHQVIEESGGERISRGVQARVGGTLGREARAGGGHLTSVQLRLVPSDERDISARAFADRWREVVGPVPGVESLTFKFTTGPGAGSDLDIQLSHADLGVLEEASAELAERLGSFAGVYDIDDGFQLGKPQIDLRLTPAGRSLGLTAQDLARQVRSAFYGAQALRQQRRRDEMRVLVRLPLAERRSEYDIEELLIRTPAGGEIPLLEAASVERARAYTQIGRADGRRVLHVTASIDQATTSVDKLLAALQAPHEGLPPALTAAYPGLAKILTALLAPRDGPLKALVAAHPGLGYSFEGDTRERAESMRSLGVGFLIALLVIYALLAIPFRSYAQPVAVMGAIPFGLTGAVLGHLLMGFELSLISMMGVVALSGVVVNDSLVLVHAANGFRATGLPPIEAIVQAGMRRFRPILLTSLTTFFGLAPMIFETSVQARFLIPMAISLGYGVLFATFVTLLIVPASVMILADMGVGRRMST